MALRLFHGPGLTQGGNTNITIGGYWNAGDPPGDVWVNPFNGASAYTLALTVRPDNPMTDPDPLWDQPGHLSNYYEISLMHNAGGQWGTSTFQLLHAGAGGLLSISRNYALGEHYAGTNAGALVPGKWSRIFVRWRGSDNAHSIWIDSVNRTASVSGTNIPTLTYASGNHAAPLQIGAFDAYDCFAFAGAYAEVACWNAYLSDADAIAYGQGASPSSLTNVGRVAYVTLKVDTIGPRRPVGTYASTHPDCATVGPDEWTGVLYGNDLVTYNFQAGDYSAPYQGVFDTYQVVSDPESPSLMLPDVKILPQRQFETFERLGAGHIGKRSGITHTVSAATAAALQEAVSAVNGYGQDVIVPLGFDIALNGATITFPDTRSWTNDATTPRCCPPAQRFTLNAMATHSAQSGRVAQSARVSAGEPSYVIIRSDNLAALPPTSMRHIRLPDGTMVHGLHENGKVKPTHANLMPIIRMGNAGPALFGTSVDAWLDHWCIQGINLLGRSNGLGSMFFDMRAKSQHGVYFTWKNDGNKFLWPGKFIVNQCLLDGDPGDLGYSCTQIGFVNSISGFAIFNSYCDRFWTD